MCLVPGVLEAQLLALELGAVEPLERDGGLIAGELDEREPLQHADRSDLGGGHDRTLGQRPAQIVFGDSAALATVDEQLDRAVAGSHSFLALGGVVAPARAWGVLDPLLGRLPLADRGLRLSL